MQGKTLIKLLIVAAIAIFVWKKGIPWWNEHHSSGTSATSAADDSCVSAAVAASEAWGSSIGRFAHPPLRPLRLGRVSLARRAEHSERRGEVPLYGGLLHHGQNGHERAAIAGQ